MTFLKEETLQEKASNTTFLASSSSGRVLPFHKRGDHILSGEMAVKSRHL